MVLVPQTPDDTELLRTIYNARRDFFAKVYITMFLAAFAFARIGIDKKNRQTGRTERWEENEDARYVSRTGMYFISLLYLQAFVIGSGTILYLKRIHPFKKDIESKTKQQLAYTIVRKEHFDHIDQYYFYLNDSSHMHEQVDKETYDSLQPGDQLYVYCGQYSKYFFNPDGRFSFI